MIIQVREWFIRRNKEIKSSDTKDCEKIWNVNGEIKKKLSWELWNNLIHIILYEPI